MNETAYWDELWAKPSQEKENNFARRAFQLIKAKKFSTLLDLGCGDGRDAIYFAQNGLKVTAIDFSSIAMNKLRTGNPDLNCILGDIRDLEFEDKSFDVVYSHLSMQYFDDETTDKILENIYKILVKEGLLFIKCKSVDDQLYGQGEKVGEDLFMKEHLRHFFSKEYMGKKLHRFKTAKIRKNTSIYQGKKSSFIEAIAIK